MKIWLSILVVLGMLMNVAYSLDDEDGTLLYSPKNRCKRGTKKFDIGEKFTDPFNNCRVCECCETGRIKCKKKDCTKTPPPCGKDHYEASDEECCPGCSDFCVAEQASNPICHSKICPGPRGVAYYPDDSCCQACGCEWRGGIVPEGHISMKPTADCEYCVCSNGIVDCAAEAACPAERLKCVNPVVLNDSHNCNWYCPNGPTCFRGDEVIMPDEYKIIGDKVCYCYQTWYPLALCANKDHWGKFEERLNRDMCMKRPTDPLLW